jgi:FKBP-type peptidyl-prolyl cis-trans isomerase FkpA
LNRVIRCWTQALQQMKVGGKATLSCPAVTAYGAKGGGDAIPPNTDLTFEVELLAIEK